MSLKGYDWLKDDVVVMSYYFKNETLYIWKDVTEQDINDFKNYLKEKHSVVFQVKDCNKKN